MLNKYTIPVLLLVLTSCANIVQPSGGPVDKDAPVVTQETPANGSTQFSGHSFTICFDEYVQLKEPQKNVIVSPPVAKPPVIQISGKCVEVTFEKNQLKPNTTYHVQFLGAIADIHENTVLYDYGYLFSTGEKIDTLSMGGVVLDARTQKKAVGYLVGLYKEYTDSSAFKRKPDYVGMTNPLGMYRFRAIAEGKYRVVTYEDKNANLLIDAGEEAGFTETEYSPIDSIKNIKLFAFTQPLYTPGRIIDTINSATNQFELVFYQPRQPITPVDGIFSYHKKDEVWDTLVVQTANKNEVQTIEWMVNGTKQALQLTNKAENKPAFTIQHISRPYFAGDTLVLKVSNRIQSLNNDSMLINMDSTYVNCSVKTEKNSPYIYIPTDASKVKSSSIRVKLGVGAINDVYGQSNALTEFNIPVLKETDFGSLEFNIKNGKKQSVLVQLLDEKFNVMYSQQIHSADKVTFNRIRTATYLVRGVIDTNANGTWDGGNVSSGTLPERVLYLSTPVILRADWLIEGNTIDFDSVK